MRIPKRKPGKYAFEKKDPYITEAKLEKLKEKLQKAKEGRPELIEEVKRLALDGDFSENHAYSLAKGRLRGLNNKILRLEAEIKNSIIIKKTDSGAIEIGSRVEFEKDGKLFSYDILGSAETNPKKGVISHKSPLGQALLGKEAGDEFVLKISDKEQKIKIIKIN